jgi:hypothetical protein
MACYSSDGGSPVTKIPGRGRYPWDFLGVERPDDLAEANWLTQLPYPGQQVRNFVPEVFESYVRVFFPIRPKWPRVLPLIWSEVARRNGWVVHAEMTAEAICRPAAGKEMDPPDLHFDDVSSGLPPEQLAVLAAVLARHTTTPETTSFALWEGYGDLMVGLEDYTDAQGRRRIRQPPMLVMPIRRTSSIGARLTLGAFSVEPATTMCRIIGGPWTGPGVLSPIPTSAGSTSPARRLASTRFSPPPPSRRLRLSPITPLLPITEIPHCRSPKFPMCRAAWRAWCELTKLSSGDLLTDELRDDNWLVTVWTASTDSYAPHEGPTGLAAL